MSGFYTEADYENSIIELLQGMGYRHVYGPDIERDFNIPLYEDELIAALHRLNPTMPDDAITDALFKLKNFENAELVQKNFVFMDYPKFLEEIGKMKEKNLAVELLKKLISEQVSIYRRTNVVKSEKFSEIIQQAMNRYLNGMLTNEQVIEELLKLAKQIKAAQKEGEQLGLTADELAFYDALTKPQAIKDFYENEELIAITKELADTLRKNRTIDWQKRDSARAKMRMMIKKLLKKHRYPPEGMDDAVQTVMTQCELWTDNADLEGNRHKNVVEYAFSQEQNVKMVAEDSQSK